MTEREIGPYRVKDQIPFRGPGRRFAGNHAVLGRKVTIREIPCASFAAAEGKDAFLRAAKIVQRHAPEGVAVVHHCVEDGEWISLVCEPWGESMEEHLKSGGLLPPHRAVAFCVSVLEGLRFLHQHGIVHGNVSGHSVMMQADGTAKLVEWGGPRRSDLASYLSPECAAGKDPTEEDDLYAVGALLRRLVGEGGSAALGDVLQRALSADPGARFPDAREFLAALEALPPTGEPAEGGDSLPPLLCFPGRRVPWSLLFALIVALFVFISMTRKTEPLPQVPHQERNPAASLPGLPPLPPKEVLSERQKGAAVRGRPERRERRRAAPVEAQE